MLYNYIKGGFFIWQIIAGIGIVFVLLEIFVPSMFFLNLAAAAFVTAIISVFIKNIDTLIWIFSGLSLLFIFLLRPILLNAQNKQGEKTGIEDKYLGKVATVIENVDANGGAITRYDERWQAKNIEEGVIEAGQKVKIISNDSLIMNVKKID